MLEVNPETVCRLAELARTFHGREEVDITDEPLDPGGDEPSRILADYAGDTALAEFRNIVSDLEPDQQQQIVALLWLGRGDFTLDEWTGAIEEAADNWTEHTADYLIAHPLLADHLAEGLDQHGYDCD